MCPRAAQIWGGREEARFQPSFSVARKTCQPAPFAAFSSEPFFCLGPPGWPCWVLTYCLNQTVGTLSKDNYILLSVWTWFQGWGLLWEPHPPPSWCITPSHASPAAYGCVSLEPCGKKFCSRVMCHAHPRFYTSLRLFTDLKNTSLLGFPFKSYALWILPIYTAPWANICLM